MSSEFDMSFEDFLNYDFDSEVLGSGFSLPGTQDQRDGGDSKMLDFPTEDFQTCNDMAWDQSTPLVQPYSAPWTGDVASNELPPLQDTTLNLKEPGESE
jgi:hypothetical protein